jgi:amino acid adenylation domain-containing protein
MSLFHDYIITPFLRSLERFSNRDAFCINGQLYTYAVLAECISKIRYALKQKRISESIVGIIANDDLDTYASIFAVWFEGLAYVPIHPKQPVERVQDIIAQAEICLIIDSDSNYANENVEFIRSKSLVSGVSDLVPISVPDQALAYILFTSGSTGKPKGVQITRKNLGAFMKSFLETGILINEKDRCLQAFDLTFDVSVQSFIVPLTKGACTYTIPHDQIKYSYVSGLLEEHQLTFGAMAPSMIRYLRPFFNELRVPSMRYNILTAEASPLELVEAWSECIPNAEIYDFYGPTETTIYCTYYRFNRSGDNKQLNGMLSIGKPMQGLNVLIIDKEGQVLQANQRGELYVCGDQVTTGYWNNIEKNKTSFAILDFKDSPTRFYKTGDLCYIDNEGDIMLVGRLDHQVKIQGYRVELGEIEYHSRYYLKDQNAIACAFTNSMGNTEIALFVEGPLPDQMSLTRYLMTKLPYYMVPTKIMTEEKFPLNMSGKVDRICLEKKLKLNS